MAVVEVKAKPTSAFAEFWYYFSHNKGAVIGLVIFVALVILAIFAPVVAPYLPNEQNRSMLLLPPFWGENGTTDYIYDTSGNRLITHNPDGTAILYLPQGMEVHTTAAGATSRS